MVFSVLFGCFSRRGRVSQPGPSALGDGGSVEVLEGREGLCGRRVDALSVPLVLITTSVALEWKQVCKVREGSRLSYSVFGPQIGLRLGDQATYRRLGVRLGFVTQLRAQALKLERTRPQSFAKAWDKHRYCFHYSQWLARHVDCREEGRPGCDPGWLLVLCVNEFFTASVSSVSSFIPTTPGLVQESPGQMEKAGTQPAS